MTIQQIQQILQSAIKVIEILLTVVSQLTDKFGGKN